MIQYIYGWNSPGRTSLLEECHQNVCTLGLLTRSVLIEIAWDFLRTCPPGPSAAARLQLLGMASLPRTRIVGIDKLHNVFNSVINYIKMM